MSKKEIILLALLFGNLPIFMLEYYTDLDLSWLFIALPFSIGLLGVFIYIELSKKK